MQLRTKRDLRTGWTVKQQDDESGPWLPVKHVPTEIHIDLLENKKIPDPFVDTNELAVRWIAEKKWVYRVSFEVPSSQGVITDLVFEGLDTFASVTLNGSKILESDNMHISHRVNISSLIQSGQKNELEVVFDSAMLRGRKLAEKHKDDHTFYVRQTEVSRVPVRKAQYHWGWDWGPILTTAGPWRPVFIEQYAAKIDDVWAQYQVSSDLSTCTGFLYARLSEGVQAQDKITLSLSYEDAVVFEQECSVESNGLVKAEFEVAKPSLWYPHGYGAQSRYLLRAVLKRGDAKLDEQAKMTGFRRAELIQEKDDYGKSFYFRINGIDIFAGGSCWIPTDSFLSQVSRDRYFDWIKLLVEGNQVMIRVWGGGIYEDDSFMDACDELGVLVWHDFAFACASYPVYSPYIDSVEEEARQNIRRFRTHPSLVLWAGNNEDYQVQERYKLEYNYEDKDPESWKKSTFPARYMYEYLLPKLVQEEDPYCPYHPSSPWGDGKHTADPTVGDIHQWNIWHGQMLRYQDADQLSGRFVSEFGMEAYPHLETLNRSITDPKQRHPGSRMMDYRNRAIDHERRMLTYVAENFLVRYDLPSFAHLTQTMQAETMRSAYKAWRRMWRKTASRKCGGVLVWQLNDCWPTMSWAVVDYYLVKKPAFYAIARALRPLDVGVARNCPEWTSGHADPSLANKTEFDLWIVSSRQEAVEVDLTIKFISIRSGEAVSNSIEKKVTATSNGTTEVIQNQKVETFESHDNLDWDHQDPFVIHATISVAGKVVATDTAWPQPYKYLDFSDRNVKVEASSSKGQITISADLPTKGFVFEERAGMRLSDNGFDLVPGEKHVVDFSAKDVAAEELTWRYVGCPDKE